jgi:hypothetical protein
MKTVVIKIEIEHTDRTFNSEPVQDFIKSLGSPDVNWTKAMKKAFKETTLGQDAHNIDITYALKQEQL